MNLNWIRPNPRLLERLLFYWLWHNLKLMNTYRNIFENWFQIPWNWIWNRWMEWKHKKLLLISFWFARTELKVDRHIETHSKFISNCFRMRLNTENILIDYVRSKFFWKNLINILYSIEKYQVLLTYFHRIKELEWLCMVYYSNILHSNIILKYNTCVNEFLV